LQYRSYVNTYLGSVILGTAAGSIPKLKPAHPRCPYGQAAVQIPSAALEGNKILLRSLGHFMSPATVIRRLFQSRYVGDRQSPGGPSTLFSQPVLQIPELNSHQCQHPSHPPTEQNGALCKFGLWPSLMGDLLLYSRCRD